MAFREVFKRIEKKYLMSGAQYEELRRRLEPIAAVDKYGQTTILNIYYDTPDDQLIRRSLEKPVYKEKLRLRTYGVPQPGGQAFVEIKKKYKGVVYKRRVSAPYEEALAWLDGSSVPLSERSSRIRHSADGDEQILREIDYFQQFYQNLEPKMVIAYDRIAMAGREDPELRITFDTNLRWRTQDLDLRSGGYGRQLLQEGQVLCELKIAGAVPMELVRMFSELEIYPVSCSKYGNAYMLQQQELAEELRRGTSEAAGTEMWKNTQKIRRLYPADTQRKGAAAYA